MTNALAAVLVTFLALAAARRTRCALAALAAMPMTLALDVSASHDALMIALVFLAVGMIDRVIDENRDATRLETALIAARSPCRRWRGRPTSRLRPCCC